ncbi:MAG: ATP-binding protein [Thermoproteota archaeon]|nr:ATP-binding protein [Candidatus Brockarchaeota archaeon]
MMLFSDRPKTNLSELYNMEKEVKALVNALEKGSAIVLILGLRRLGKTSLLRSVLNSLGKPSLIFDLRSFEGLKHIPGVRLATLLEEGLNAFISKQEGFLKVLKKIKGVEVIGLRVSVAAGKSRNLLPELLEKVNDWAREKGEKVVMAFDEAQLLSGSRIDFSTLLAHAYDYLDYLQFVLTGSEAGLLYDFLKMEDPESPLYGRYVEEIHLNRLNAERSIEFLRLGFKEAGLEVKQEDLENAVEKLDGIIGWLSYYGLVSVSMGEAGEKALEATINKASKIAELEISRLLKKLNSDKYITILKALSTSPLQWAEVKNVLIAKHGVAYDRNVSNLLSKLVKTGLVEKENGLYKIADPIYRYALRRMR